MSAIECKALRKVYGKRDAVFEALRGIDIAIQKGESVALVGKSGAGKSTLMHLLALLDAPTSGSIIVNGVDASKLKGNKLNEIRNEQFGFVFQQFFMNANDSVINNVMLPLKIGKVSGSKRKQMALDALRAVQLEEKAKNKANDLSGGQKQRVCIARAIVNNPSIIFADEPTGNLDSNTSELIESLLFGLHKQKGITLIVVTHDPDLAAKCDRQISILDGLVESNLSSAQIPNAAGKHSGTHAKPNAQGLPQFPPAGKNVPQRTTQTSAPQTSPQTSAPQTTPQTSMPQQFSPVSSLQQRLAKKPQGIPTNTQQKSDTPQKSPLPQQPFTPQASQAPSTPQQLQQQYPQLPQQYTPSYQQPQSTLSQLVTPNFAQNNFQTSNPQSYSGPQTQQAVQPTSQPPVQLSGANVLQNYLQNPLQNYAQPNNPDAQQPYNAQQAQYGAQQFDQNGYPIDVQPSNNPNFQPGGQY